MQRSISSPRQRQRSIIPQQVSGWGKEEVIFHQKEIKIKFKADFQIRQNVKGQKVCHQRQGKKDSHQEEVQSGPHGGDGQGLQSGTTGQSRPSDEAEITDSPPPGFD